MIVVDLYREHEGGEPDPLDLKYNVEPVCPHCGHKMRDAWELGDGKEGDDFEAECGECERPYLVSRHLSVSYSTRKP